MITINLIGNVGQDPKIDTSMSGVKYAKTSLACNTKNKETHWFSLTVFGKRAETLVAYVKKGSKLYITGELQPSEYQDNDGNKRFSLNVIVDDFQFLDKKPDESVNNNASSKFGLEGNVNEQDEIPF